MEQEEQSGHLIEEVFFYLSSNEFPEERGPLEGKPRPLSCRVANFTTGRRGKEK